MDNLSPERRRALAEAIDAEALARSNLADAKAAVARASEGSLNASMKGNALAKALDEIEIAKTNDGDAVIRSILNGGNIGELVRPADELRQKIAEAEREATQWRAARKKAEEAIVARRDALGWAVERTARAAAAVIEAEADVEALLAEANAAQSVVLTKRAELLALARALPEGCAKRKEIDAFLARPWLEVEFSGSWPNLPEAISITAWRDALRSDAQAARPV
ncbi:hypothetical protein AMST5_02152 [freshwater sediment metagenome]|uniref:Uncharacterized protein n=1 Tax=freshwater sediment metagenome TaxID=556182 RepID=A0AA48LZI2_9ZZZZ